MMHLLLAALCATGSLIALGLLLFKAWEAR